MLATFYFTLPRPPIGSIYFGIESLRSGHRIRGRPCKQNTTADHVDILKGFLFWLIESEYLELPEKKIRRIKSPPKDTITKRAAELQIPKEIMTFLGTSIGIRNRGFVNDHVRRRIQCWRNRLDYLGRSRKRIRRGLPSMSSLKHHIPAI